MAVFAVFSSGTDVGRYARQNTEDSARAVINDTPWWAACRVLSTSPRSEGGTITLSLYRITPSVDVMFSRY